MLLAASTAVDASVTRTVTVAVCTTSRSGASATRARARSTRGLDCGAVAGAAVAALLLELAFELVAVEHAAVATDPTTTMATIDRVCMARPTNGTPARFPRCVAFGLRSNEGMAMFEWPDEMQMIRDAVRQFVDNEVRPHR